jgi:hypothetical protein
MGNHYIALPAAWNFRPTGTTALAILDGFSAYLEWRRYESNSDFDFGGDPARHACSAQPLQLTPSSGADPAAQPFRRQAPGYGGVHRGADDSVSAKRSLLVYVITGGLQFGTVDLRSGAFLPIGPGIPPDVGVALVQGSGRSVLTLAFSGNLDAIDPVTGVTRVVGPTGLGDCSTQVSPCGPNSPNAFGSLDGRLYATDFASNLYSVNPVTGAARLIGPTGMPPLTFIPLSTNADGTVNVYSSTLFSARGKLYAIFATATVDFATGTVKPVIPGALYQVNPETGHARLIAPTDTNITATVNVNDIIYGFDPVLGQVVTINLTNGDTTPVTDVDSALGVVGGATPARPTQTDH